MPVKKNDSLKTDSNASKIKEKAEKVEKQAVSEEVKPVEEKKNAPQKGAQKTKYSCGCPVVEIGDGRIKAKCIKHGVE